MRLVLLALCALMIVGCSGKKYCERVQTYETVEPEPMLQAPPGLSVPEPDPSYRVPEISANAQAAALSGQRPCLEMPPRLRSNTVVEEET